MSIPIAYLGMLPLTFMIVSVQSKVHTCGVVCGVAIVISGAWLIPTRLFVATGRTHLAVHKGRAGLLCWENFKAEPKARREPIEHVQQQTGQAQQLRAPSLRRNIWNLTNQNAACIYGTPQFREILPCFAPCTLLAPCTQPPTSYSIAYSPPAPRSLSAHASKQAVASTVGPARRCMRY